MDEPSAVEKGGAGFGAADSPSITEVSVTEIAGHGTRSLTCSRPSFCPMTEWEYKIVELDDGGLFGGGEEPTEASLDELGAAGWELAAALTGSSRSLGGRPRSETDALVFKRPKA